ncbi:MAG TPA: helix-turn-helix transcriptional regulator [Verrucomicrobiae bacterium]|jgi:transcriptional regulator with XRE-family HTH domain|nr:helix-turn-helix transcriptional regulator [Verrucomicrobiae bacterium]
MPKKSGLVTPREVEIGTRVKRFRDQINWPQPAFAAELGISRDRLASIEYGRTPLRYNVGYRLCFIFDVNHRWLATGEGEIKAATAALELPRPEGLPNRALFSGICDELHAGRPARRAAGRERKKTKEGELIPHFDPTAHVVGFLSDLFAKEKFRSPVERQEFALEITSYARELALRIRRERNKERYLGVSEARKGEGSTRNVGAVSGLRESIRKLEQETKKLSASLEPGNSDSVTSTSLPRSSESEVIRLQDAIDKIAAQIGGTEASVKILLSSGKE